MPGGRPLKYATPELMQEAIDKYFKETSKITICGLALSLGFISRQSLLDYSGYSEEFSCTIKAAKSRVEQYYEEHLVQGNAGGPIFALKNFNWKDKTEQVHELGDGMKELIGDICGRGQGIPIKTRG